MNRLPNWIIFGVFLLIAGKAYADCSVSATGVNFGNYDVFVTTTTESTGTINITCDTVSPTDVVISINPSLHSGVFNPRQMKNLTSAYLLNYNLYTDKKKRSVWGDGTGGTDTVTIKNVKKKKSKTETIYGSIPPGQNAFVGSYSDVLTVTITF